MIVAESATFKVPILGIAVGVPKAAPYFSVAIGPQTRPSVFQDEGPDIFGDGLLPPFSLMIKLSRFP